MRGVDQTGIRPTASPPAAKLSAIRNEDGTVDEEALVVVVDDDAAVREALGELLQSVGLAVTQFATTQDLLASDLPDRPGCLVLDVRMPGLSGLDLQRHLATKSVRTPVVFLTGQGDIAMSVQAMKAGAIDFLTKPVRDQTFLDAVTAAINADRVRRSLARETLKVSGLYAALTNREKQVLRAVVAGTLNKQIAFDLGISEVTVKLHRSSMMRKMQATSTARLFQMWQSLTADVRER